MMMMPRGPTGDQLLGEHDLEAAAMADDKHASTFPPTASATAGRLRHAGYGTGFT